MRRRAQFLATAALLVVSGCYHQVVRTGAEPSNVVVERPWTATYLFGLVPADAINTAAQCPNGVAVIETQQTFVNGLVAVLTLGIYTPQSVTITCAAGGAMMINARRIPVPVSASSTDRATAVKDAIELAQRTGEMVVVFSVDEPASADHR